MKICYVGFDLPEGKVKYQDSKLLELEKKFSPHKLTPFFAEFIKDDFIHCDSILISKERILDLIILDMDKLEARLERTSDEDEKIILTKCLKHLEKETPLCELLFKEDEWSTLRELAPLSLKPTLVEETLPEVNGLIGRMLDKSNTIFFYTAGKKEVRAWPVKKHSDIVACAGKIHSDLARGFIKADVVNYEDFLQVYNMQEARSKGLLKLVDRDYIIRQGDIIEIRFNV
ncbi:MAG: DUF933 domain-containing protein [Candidatus Tectomicrobia bacterium]|uniref:DUF933 domain-containing protein n=1 Tax=Tectimicrobiota bacterium TaxID=2528274 RepID=A0A933GNX5_UNCTE|nr:DUF933 domain-containing protein [Candidatus Tectomicrobia bacterium]